MQNYIVMIYLGLTIGQFIGDDEFYVGLADTKYECAKLVKETRLDANAATYCESVGCYAEYENKNALADLAGNK